MNHFARRGRWYDDEIIMRYGGGGYEREEPDFDGMTVAGAERNRDEVEVQRILQAKNKERIAAIRAKAQAGRKVNRGHTMGGVDRNVHKPTKILRDRE
jgi:hypothetical protein